jgi:lysine-specific demethylase 8/hypoxia-inducible factor 1-alpha inhibitor (HIF hydroxylase)
MIDRVHATALSSKEFSDRYQIPGVPVVVQGLLEKEPVWDLDFLCQTLGNHVFPVRHYGQARYQQDKRRWTSSGSGVKAHSMPFSDYAEKLKTGVAQQEDLYMGRCSLTHTPLHNRPNLLQAEAWFNLKFPATAMNLWIGGGGHTSCLHYDPMDGILMQLYGAKKVILFPPNQTYNLYPIPLYKPLKYGLALRAVYSQVYPDRPDLNAFPKFAQAQPYAQETILNPGDILFIPAGWWHEVTSLGEDVVCSVNRFWNVLPLSRAFRSWNKWRAHLGSVLALPHVMGNFILAAVHPHSENELSKLFQRL